MEGLIKEGQKMMGEDMTPEVQDAAIIAAAQKIEHYEISSYGTARAFALHLGMKDVARLIEQTLNEEYEADGSLNELAMGKVNLEADEGLQSLRKLTANERSSTGRDASSSSRTSERSKSPAQRSVRAKSSTNGSTAKASASRASSPKGGKGTSGRSKSQSSSRSGGKGPSRTSGSGGRKSQSR